MAKVELVTLNAAELKFREIEQTNVEFVRGMVEQMGFVPTITATRGENGYTIIDGHNRVRVAREMGLEVPTAVIDAAEYETLEGHKFAAITAAMLLEAGDVDGADEIIRMDGSDLFDEIDEIRASWEITQSHGARRAGNARPGGKSGQIKEELK